MVDTPINELSCRICLAPCSPNDIDATNIASDYKSCVGFEITEDDGALKLCQICMAELSLVKRFHDKCQTSELRLIKFRAENWGRLQDMTNNTTDEPLIPINYNPNEMDITVMPLQVSMHIGSDTGGNSGGGSDEPPLKRGRGRPKKVKPAEHTNSLGRYHQNPLNPQVQARMQRRNSDAAWNQTFQHQQFQMPYMNEQQRNNMQQFLNVSPEKQANYYNNKATALAGTTTSPHHTKLPAVPPPSVVPYFCGICNRRFPFKTQNEVQLHIKMHYGAANQQQQQQLQQQDNNFFHNQMDPFGAIQQAAVAAANVVASGGAAADFNNQIDPRMHHFIYPNKFVQQSRGYQRMAK